MHTCKGIIGHIVALCAEFHCIDDIPGCVYLFLSGNVYALGFNIIFVEIYERHIYRNFSLGFFIVEAVKNICDIGAVNIAAASAAFYVFDCSLAEKSNLFTLFQRQSAVFVFEKNRSLCRRFS